MNLPEKYLENMKELLGTDFDAYKVSMTAVFTDCE